MSFLHIDSDTCVRCGLCVKVCPTGVLKCAGTDSAAVAPPNPPPLPSVIPERARHCILCGHCQAVCPSQALVHTGLPRLASDKADAQCRSQQVGLFNAASAQAFLDASATRRSCRHFAKQALTREQIAALCDAARFAPSGHNQRQIQWTAVASREGMAVVLAQLTDWMSAQADAHTPLARNMNLAGAVRAVSKGRDVVLRGAPHLLVAHAPVDGLTPEQDALIACAHVEMAAHAAGLGACWCGYLMFALETQHEGGASDASSQAASRRLAQTLGIAPERRGFAALLLGRKAFGYAQRAPREPLPLHFVY